MTAIRAYFTMKTKQHFTMKRALILNYHQLIEDGTQLPDSRFSLRYSMFVQQLKMIQHLGIPVLSLDDWANGEGHPDFSVILTFDDGFESDHALAIPFLKTMNFHATFFPFTDGIGTENRITWKNLVEMSEYGFTIGSHGVSHTDLRTVSTARLIGELRNSKLCIEEKIGKPIEFFALPFGGNNRMIENEAKTAGYSRILTTERRINYTDGSHQLHRWNIKSDTSLVEFEKMLRLNHTLLKRKKLISNLNQLRSRAMIYVKNTLASNRR